MNLERVDAERSDELGLPEGTILLNQMEYIIEVLMKFEPRLQVKTRTTPGNQESFASTKATHLSTDEAIQEYIQSLQALAHEDIIEADKVKTTSPELHYNSDQMPVNFPAIVGCLNWIALRTRPDIAGDQSSSKSYHTWPGHLFDSCQAYMLISTSYSELRVAICSSTQSKRKLWVLGDASFAPTGEKSQQGIVVYHGITSNLNTFISATDRHPS